MPPEQPVRQGAQKNLLSPKTDPRPKRGLQGMAFDREDVENSRKLTNDTRLDMTRFAEYDSDGNCKLDFEEFYAMQPARVRNEFTSAQIHEWFDAADLNTDGVLSINEFFRWSLMNASQKHGAAALEHAFTRYDKDGTGMLDALEFERVCKDMGYGAVAQGIFSGLDNDGSGAITYRELIESMTSNPPADTTTKQLLTALVYSYDSEASAASLRKNKLDTTGWVIHGRDAPSVQRELQTLLRQSGGHVADLIAIFDEDATVNLTVDFMEFHNTMRYKFGFRGEEAIIDAVFKSLDVDGDGVVAFEEIFEFVRGRKHSLDARSKVRRHSMKMEPPTEFCDPATGREMRLNLDAISWDGEALRVLIQQMLERCAMTPADLLRAWDSDKKDGTLTRHEFVNHVKSLLSNEDADLWELEVKAVAHTTFDEIMREVRGVNVMMSIGIIHLVKWLDDPPFRASFVLKDRRQLRKVRERRAAAANKEGEEARVDLATVRKKALDKAASKAKIVAQIKRERTMRAYKQYGLPPLRWETKTPHSSTRPFSLTTSSPTSQPTSPRPGEATDAALRWPGRNSPFPTKERQWAVDGKHAISDRWDRMVGETDGPDPRRALRMSQSLPSIVPRRSKDEPEKIEVDLARMRIGPGEEPRPTSDAVLAGAIAGAIAGTHLLPNGPVMLPSPVKQLGPPLHSSWMIPGVFKSEAAKQEAAVRFGSSRIRLWCV